MSDLAPHPTTVAKGDLHDEGSVDPVYQAKARVLNQALQEIGMGKYQLVTGLILSPTLNEFHFNGPFLSLATNIGLLVGAVLWSFGCDIWGRKWSFNLTILIGSIFGIAMGGSATFVVLASLAAASSVGIGGNIPVDSAVFLGALIPPMTESICYLKPGTDFVPSTHQYLLTILSIWWAIGQLLSSLIAWPLIANFSCAPSGSCTRSDNMGWRYLVFTLGGIMLLLAFLRLSAFPLHESPRYLLGRGRDEDAVAIVHEIARYNGTETGLTVEDLEEAARSAEEKEGTYKWRVLSEGSEWTAKHVRALFATKKMAWSTSLLIWIWGLIGLASTLYNNFLPYLLASRGAKFQDATYFITYRNRTASHNFRSWYTSAFIAGWSIELPFVGRRGTLAHGANAGLTGAILFASTTARSSPELLGWNCGYAFFSNIMFGVLYAASPEVFPANHRGTGNGLTATATRIFGVLAPIIALYANLNTAVPVFVAGALIIGAGGLALLLPFEPRGKASI
ncbi:MFS general substrate transporter [Russula compacta]|nr:MFS general substrate transporter [Russula compacta]